MAQQTTNGNGKQILTARFVSSGTRRAFQNLDPESLKRSGLYLHPLLDYPRITKTELKLAERSDTRVHKSIEFDVMCQFALLLLDKGGYNHVEIYNAWRSFGKLPESKYRVLRFVDKLRRGDNSRHVLTFASTPNSPIPDHTCLSVHFSIDENRHPEDHYEWQLPSKGRESKRNPGGLSEVEWFGPMFFKRNYRTDYFHSVEGVVRALVNLLEHQHTVAAIAVSIIPILREELANARATGNKPLAFALELLKQDILYAAEGRWTPSTYEA